MNAVQGLPRNLRLMCDTPLPHSTPHLRLRSQPLESAAQVRLDQATRHAFMSMRQTTRHACAAARLSLAVLPCGRAGVLCAQMAA